MRIYQIYVRHLGIGYTRCGWPGCKQFNKGNYETCSDATGIVCEAEDDFLYDQWLEDEYQREEQEKEERRRRQRQLDNQRWAEEHGYG